MAYPRKHYRGRRRRRHRKSRYGVYSAAGKQLWRDVKKLKDIINTEYKFSPFNHDAMVDNIGTLTPLGYPSQGTGDTARVGDSIKLQRLSARGSIVYNGGSSVARIIILNDKQSTVGNVWDYLDDTAYNTVNAPYSPKDYDNRFTTKTLYDKTFCVSADNPHKLIDIDLPLNFHTQFIDGTTSRRSGALQMITLSSSETSNLPYVRLNGKITFTDN